MSTKRTRNLRIAFVVSKCDDGDSSLSYYECELESIGPRGVFTVPIVRDVFDPPIDEQAGAFVCSGCSEDDPPLGLSLCDACAVENSIDNAGPNDFVNEVLGKEWESVGGRAEGTLVIEGHMVWTHYSGPEGEDWDEEWVMQSALLTPPEAQMDER